MNAELVRLPAQPEGVPWPTRVWPSGRVPDGVRLDPLLDAAMDPDGELARTRAVVVVHGGRLVAERYAGFTDAFGQPAEPITASTPLISWSMAKSMLHAVVGMLVAEGRLELDAPAPVPEWNGDDPRARITLDDLLAMRDGLDFAEDYDPDGSTSHVIEMLFGAGADDTGRYAARRPLAHEPGTTFNYSSGTSNIVSRIVRDVLGGEEPYRRFLHERLFGPIGMRSADPRFDDAGTWVASSYVWATARDMARFGTLYLRGGVWDGQRLLPEGWVDHGRRPRSVDPEDGRLYGAHWWVVGDEFGTFWANGYEGQSILVCPGLDLVVVRLGKTPKRRYPALTAWRAAVVDAFRDGS